jgi:hypothetical protein
MNDTATRPDTVIDGTTRWVVPGHYGNGPEFTTFDAAVAHARSTQTLMWNGDHSRSFVDLRQTRRPHRDNNVTVDESVMRFEVYPDRIEVMR